MNKKNVALMTNAFKKPTALFPAKINKNYLFRLYLPDFSVSIFKLLFLLPDVNSLLLVVVVKVSIDGKVRDIV